MNTLSFSKMQALGNDFIVIDGVNQVIHLTPEQIRKICDRRLGVGCDQLLLIKPAQRGGDFQYLIFNADGSPAQHCGNGARCIAQFLFKKNLSNKKNCYFEMSDGDIMTTRHDDGTVSVAMGLSFIEKTFTIDDIFFTKVMISNPHAITDAPCDDTTLQKLAKQLETHPLFPTGVNVSKLAIQDPHTLHIRTYERGVGFTPACGSAACAAAALAMKNNWVKSPVKVIMPGGEVTVTHENNALILSGSATFVFDGIWYENS